MIWKQNSSIMVPVKNFIPFYSLIVYALFFYFFEALVVVHSLSGVARWHSG